MSVSASTEGEPSAGETVALAVEGRFPGRGEIASIGVYAGRLLLRARAGLTNVATRTVWPSGITGVAARPRGAARRTLSHVLTDRLAYDNILWGGSDFS